MVDTDVFSYLLKGDTKAAVYGPHLRGKRVAISFVTVGELYHWANRRKWSPAKRAELETRLRSFVIIPFDLQVCQAYGDLCVLKNADGSDRTMAANDRWIAACAMRHRLPLVSNNHRHFENIPGLTLISEAPKRAPTPRDQTLPL